jgi:A/G-specific adenine glycosylase
LQVLEIYNSFIVRYPSLEALSRASIEDLHQILYSLGLKWRIDRLYEMVQVLNAKFQMQIPRDKNDLLSLPGVNEYIANAVRCFSFGIAEPLVDTNTIRIIGRLFALEVKPSSRRNKNIQEFISKNYYLLKISGAYNYALLDLADKVCVKKNSPELL